EKQACVVARRDRPGKEGKQMGVPLTAAAAHIEKLLRDIQLSLFTKAQTFRDANVRSADTYDEFKTLIEQPGFVWAHWDGTRATANSVSGLTERRSGFNVGWCGWSRLNKSSRT